MAMLSPKFDDLTIGHDFLFKKVMRNPRICKHLLEEVLQAPIAEISYPEIEKTIDVFYDSRGVRLDVIVADEKHTTAMVFAWTSELLTTPIRITIWKCR